MATQKINEVDEIISRLQKNRGFKAYLILNNDGVVVKWEQDGEQPLPYHKVVQYSHHILDLCNKSKSHIKDLFDAQDHQVENIRLRMESCEIIAAQEGNYTLVVIQESGQA